MEDTPSSNLPQTADTGLPDAGYAEVLADIKTRLDAAGACVRAANAELMGVYGTSAGTSPSRRTPHPSNMVVALRSHRASLCGSPRRLPRHHGILAAKPPLHAGPVPRVD